MKFNLIDWLLGMAAIAVFFAALAVINDTKKDERIISCEITQNGNVHVMPCRILSSYIMAVSL